MAEGLLGNLFQGILPSSVKPSLEGNVLNIKITEAEFVEMATKGIDPRVKSSLQIRLKEGVIEITLKMI